MYSRYSEPTKGLPADLLTFHAICFISNNLLKFSMYGNKSIQDYILVYNHDNHG